MTPTQNLHVVRFNCTTLATKVSIPMKTDDSLSKIEFQDMCASKHTLSVPHSSRTHNSPEKIAEVKDTSMRKCTYFSAWRPQSFLKFSQMNRRGSRHYQNTLPETVGSDCTFVYIDSLLHSVFTEKLFFCKAKSQASENKTYIHTLSYCILSQNMGGECWLSYNFAKVYSTLL